MENSRKNKNPGQMKWWGWGDENIEFDMSSKPGLWPFIKRHLGITDEGVKNSTVKIEEIELPPQNINQGFLDAIRTVFAEDQIQTGNKERLLHTYGKSFRDLWRIRKGIIDAAPDCIVYPDSEEQICSLINSATTFDVVIIAFGGGSNIAGCLEVRGNCGRMVVSLDLKRMDKVLHVDSKSCTARIQAGVKGPHMEEQLGSHGFTLGHFPDSFEYSTLGGWIATRSAGMQSDKYGKIEDMVLSLRMVTPSGTIVTRTVPKSSNGIDVNHLCIGSEGILGVITEATLQVHHCPEVREFYGFLFPDFESGVNAITACIEQECAPAITRLNDPGKTALSFAYKTKAPPMQIFISKMIKKYLKSVKKFDMDNCCMMITAFEGNKRSFREQVKKVIRIYKNYGAFNLGTGPGRSFERAKYDFPYLRDYVMDRNIMADVSETATVWANILPLYYSTMDAINNAVVSSGSMPFLGCHVSHSYHSGASLYFTFACVSTPGNELKQYLYIKKAAEDAFLKGGATLSHHHAVGTEHLPWVEEDISPTGVKAVKALKAGLDPGDVMNPGKIIPTENSLEDWGLEKEQIESFEKTRD